jgi:2-oxoglutarate dehydrogenase E2 component (dihydrolipoamide succinyltransferase)
MGFTGMHTIKEKPVAVNGEIVIRPVMVVALTYDHRMLDGREAVTFLGKFMSVGVGAV